MKTLFQIAGVIIIVSIMGACKSASSSVKTQPDGITEKYWKLIEINGKTVAGDDLPKQPFIILKAEGNLVTGNGGCNTLTGTYEIDRTANRIKFSQMATTLMACLNMEVEDQLKRALEMADNYSLSSDGKYLSLNRARMAPLARFEVVYLK
jgi:heat shock protein HslJ